MRRPIRRRPEGDAVHDDTTVLPLTDALASVITAAVGGEQRVGLLNAVVEQPGTAPDRAAVPLPRRPLDDGPQAA
jgi:hypothetical protein